MTSIDYLFLVPAAAIIGLELFGLMVFQPEILVKGRVAGTAGSRVMFLILLAAAAFRFDDVMKLPLIYAAMLAVFGLHSFLKGGPGKKAFYHGFKKIPYDAIEFYQDVRDFKGGFSMNFRCLDGRSIVLLYKEEQRAELERIMNEHRIRDYDSFHFFEDISENIK